MRLYLAPFKIRSNQRNAQPLKFGEVFTFLIRG